MPAKPINSKIEELERVQNEIKREQAKANNLALRTGRFFRILKMESGFATNDRFGNQVALYLEVVDIEKPDQVLTLGARPSDATAEPYKVHDLVKINMGGEGEWNIVEPLTAFEALQARKIART